MEAVKRTESFRGLPTGWLEEGSPDNPILLCLHGYPDTPAVWEPFVKHFAERFQVVRPYTRGLKPSTPAGDLGRYGGDGAALDYLQILRQVDPGGRRSVALVGHDLGAVQACHLAPLLGDRLKTMVIFNGLSIGQFARRLAKPRQLARSWYMFLFQIPRLPELLVRAFPERVLAAGRGRLTLAPAEAERSGEARLAPLVAPLNQYRARFRTIPAALAAPVRRLRCPVVVIWGIHDPFLITPTREEWERVAADVRIRLLRGGHWIFREKAGEVNTLLDEHFRKVEWSAP